MNPISAAHKKLTYEAYRCFPDDGRRHEVIQGDHFVNPAPSTYHQTVSRKIQFQLFAQIEETGAGVVYDAPVDLQLSEHDIVQPDLVIVLEGRRQIVTPSKIKGVPDMIVEIISPSSTDNDRVLKRNLYERSGVPEYWIVDPFEHEVTQLVLSEQSYRPVEHGDVVLLSVCPMVSVDLGRVW